MKVQCAHTEMKNIPGWDGYLASSSGRVISEKTGLSVKEIQRKDGYLNVQLYSRTEGRSARVMELSPAYCDVIISRWELYSGKTAELIDG